MKLSEAIRLGAMEGPQGFWSSSVTTSSEKRCAIGAAAWAVGALRASSGATYVALNRECPLFMANVAVGDIPAAALYDHLVGSVPTNWSVIDVMWRLNDVAKWTREQIADWVETIEAQHEAAAAQSSPVPVTQEA